MIGLKQESEVRSQKSGLRSQKSGTRGQKLIELARGSERKINADVGLIRADF
jgi:hypothetical protein